MSGSDPFLSTFQFQAVDLDTLGSSEYTLVQLCVDDSGSVRDVVRQEESAIKSIIDACRKATRKDCLLLRTYTFNDRLTERHGFKHLMECHPVAYDNLLRGVGGTALFDAAIDGADALARQGRILQEEEYTVNGILFVITDGHNEHGLNRSASSVKASLDRAVKGENLESLVSVLIGVNVTDPDVATYLATFAKEAGFTQFVNAGEATPQKLARLAEFVSKSISNQSQACGSKKPSTTLASI